jgi:hypothetical protein
LSERLGIAQETPPELGVGDLVQVIVSLAAYLDDQAATCEVAQQAHHLDRLAVA